jgi:hypothetical protein
MLVHFSLRAIPQLDLQQQKAQCSVHDSSGCC